MTIREILDAQSRFFADGRTRPPAFRRQCLRKLLEEIRRREKDICRALHEDLRKTEFESRTTETGIIKEEVRQSSFLYSYVEKTVPYLYKGFDLVKGYAQEVFPVEENEKTEPSGPVSSF